MAARRPSITALWTDVLLFLALSLIAFPAFNKVTHGDLWLDEADYAIAGLHSVQDNRWDKSDKPDQPEALIRLRHYHAPATAIIVGFAHRYGSSEETLRLPFVIAGCLSVGMVYLCGLCLFGDRREIAAACSLLTILTPANIRMASHAIPWSFIILEIMAMLYFVMRFANRRRCSNLICIGICSGLLFVTSETFFVAVAALLACAPLVLLPELLQLARKKGFLARETPVETKPDESLLTSTAFVRGIIGGILSFLVVALVVWPAGLRGNCIKMLRHYIEMRHSESFAVNIGAQVYKIAPRWSYLYWYWHDFRPFFLCYLVGAMLAAGLYLWNFRSLAHALEHSPESGTKLFSIPAATGPLLVFCAIFLAAAHRAHIIGPEYLAHCLPLLTLCAGFIALAISIKSRGGAGVAMAVVGIIFLRWTPSKPLPGMDARTQIPRWRSVADTIKPEWQPLDRLLLGPQSSNVAFWYLHEWAHIPLHDWQIGQFPLAGPGPNFLNNLQRGKYRYVVISSEFEDNVIKAVDWRSMAVLKSWDKLIESDEHSLGPPRLTVFRYRPAPPTP